MTVRKMYDYELAVVLDALSYHPHSNIVGLTNGSACFLFDGWTNGKPAGGGSVYVHSYIPDPSRLTKGLLKEAFRYGFSHVDWLIGVTPGFNTPALDFNKRLGFFVTHRLPEGYAKGVDLVWQHMHHSACRFYQRPNLEITP